MKRTLAGALMLATLAGAVTASQAAAQPGREYGQDRRDLREDRRDVRDDRRDLRHDEHQGRHWRQGERLDSRYGAYAEVGDWRNHRLPPPRRGYHWVRSGDDYVLAALAGGAIASVIAANY